MLKCVVTDVAYGFVPKFTVTQILNEKGCYLSYVPKALTPVQLRGCDGSLFQFHGCVYTRLGPFVLSLEYEYRHHWCQGGPVASPQNRLVICWLLWRTQLLSSLPFQLRLQPAQLLCFPAQSTEQGDSPSCSCNAMVSCTESLERAGRAAAAIGRAEMTMAVCSV